MDEVEKVEAMNVEKIEAMNKYKRARKANKYVGYILVSAAISCLLMWFPTVVETVKNPLCLVVIPERWVVWQNPGFLFVVSNVIILTLAAKSGMLSSGNSSYSGLDLYAEFIKKSESMPKYYYIVDETGDSCMPVARSARPPGATRARKCRRLDETVACTSERDQDKSTAEGASESSSLIVALSDAELKKRVEDFIANFIANFNTQLRLQRQRPRSRGGL